MNEIRVPREKLVKILEKNREHHIQIFKKAQIGYRKKVGLLLQKALADVKNGKKINLSKIMIPEPQSFVQQYNQVIGLLKMGTEDTVPLTTTEFQQYIRDDWTWSDLFNNATVGYAKSVGRQRRF